MLLNNKVTIVTGGASGIGEATSRRFAQEGAAVVVADTRLGKAETVAADINDNGGHAVAIEVDVAEADSVAALVDSAVTEFGRLDVMFNNAGTLRPGTVLELDVDDWDLVMAVNVRSVYLGGKFAIPAMLASGGGSIINISSISGLVGQPTIQPVYNASKGAVRIFTKSTAVQYGKYGIRANSIHPGAIDTDMISHRIQGEESKNRIKNTVPLQRVAKPIEIAYGALFLASEESSYMTGSEMVIDGGVTAGAPNTSANS